MQETKEIVFIDPYTDFGAKRLFGPHSNPRSLIDFLNSILKLDNPITKIEYVTNEQIGELKDDRKSVFDIHGRDEEGNYIIVEIQRLKETFFKERSLFYSTYPIRNQAVKGSWNFGLKRVYTICILDFCFDDTHPDQIIHRVKLIDEESQKVFCDRLMYVYIEMPKFKKIERELITREDKWLYAINNLTRFREIPLFLSEDPVFKSFFMDADTANLLEHQLWAYYAEKKAEWDEYATRETAMELAVKERNIVFVTHLLHTTTQTEEQIAAAINVPVSFVRDIRKDILK